MHQPYTETVFSIEIVALGGEDVAIAVPRFREIMGWSQERLAHEVGVTVQTVWHWERGARPQHDNLARLKAVMLYQARRLAENLPPT